MGVQNRTGGPDSRRLQRGGFTSECDAAEALERALEQLRRQTGVGSTLTLKELVEEYLAQYDPEPETIDKLCWLLAKALRAFGGRRLPELRSQEITAWRMTISPGHRFEATQALRQVLALAVVWGMIDSNPAKQGVDNPQRRRTEKRPFEFDRHYGHLARDGCQHAIRLLDNYADIKAADVQAMDVGWTPQLPIVARRDNGNSA
jgi:hypothetical protein